MERTFTGLGGSYHGRLSAMPSRLHRCARPAVAVLSLGTELSGYVLSLAGLASAPTLKTRWRRSGGQKRDRHCAPEALDGALAGRGTTEAAAFAGRGSILVVSE